MSDAEKDEYSMSAEEDSIVLVENSSTKRSSVNFIEVTKTNGLTYNRLKSKVKESFIGYSHDSLQALDIKFYSFFGIQIFDDSDLQRFLSKETDNRIIFFCKDTCYFSYRAMLNCFKIKRKIGEGGFGKIFTAAQRFSLKEYAIKVLKPKRSEVHFNFKEIEILWKLEHPNIIKLVNYGHLEDNEIFIILEHLEGGSLKGRYP